MVGYDPDKDYLLDPQQKKDKLPRCWCCRRQIIFGEVYYTVFVKSSELELCCDCYKDITDSCAIMEADDV